MAIQIHRNLDALPPFSNAVITVGSFDGIHLGHRFILNRLVQRAAATHGDAIVVTFHPHPRKVFGDDSLRLLTTLTEKAQLLDELGIQHLVIVPFSKDFAAQSPDDYIGQFLVAHFHPHTIVLGYDHQYGKARTGDVAYMRRFESRYQFTVEEISQQMMGEVAVSSTKIRQALAGAHIRFANQLLGQPYRLTGRVVDGEKIGTSLGFPTANLAVADPDKLIPPQGIYAVFVFFCSIRYGGMLYIGNRPTLDRPLAPVIEVHLFDFNQQIYGQDLTVAFVDFLRPDQKFDSLNALQAQLHQDQQQALTVLQSYD